MGLVNKILDICKILSTLYCVKIKTIKGEIHDRYKRR